MTQSSEKSEIAAAYNDWAKTYDTDLNRTRDLAAEARVEPVVVTGMQEPTTHKILAETLHFAVAEPDVPVSGDV